MRPNCLCPGFAATDALKNPSMAGNSGLFDPLLTRRLGTGGALIDHVDLCALV